MARTRGWSSWLAATKLQARLTASMAQGRIVTVVFLIALEILTIKSNVNAYVIKQDPKRLAAVMAELEQMGGGIGGNKDDVLNDKMIDMKHDGTSQSIVPIETTAKTEEIQKSSTNITTRNEPEKTTSNIAVTAISTKPDILTTNIPETTTNGKLETIVMNQSKQATTSEISYTYEHPTTNVPTQTSIDFLLDNTETESSGGTSRTSSTTTKITETTERNKTTSYSTEAVRTDTNALSDTSSTSDIDDDSRRNIPNVTETTLSTTTLTTPTSQNRENTVIKTTSTTFSDIPTTDVKPLQKKYIILDRKRNNMIDEERSTKKENKLETAETKYQNYDSNGATVSTPEWYYINVKQESTSIKTGSTARPHDTNSISEDQAELTSEVVTDNRENLVSYLSELPKMMYPSATEIITESVTLNQYSSDSTNFRESQSTQDMHVTSEAATETDVPKTSTTEFFTTTDFSKVPTTTELSNAEAKTDQILSTSDVSSLRSPRAFNVTEATKSTESVRGTNEITFETTKTVLTSKRAGYLNMSSKPALRSETTTTEERTPTVTQDVKKISTVAEPVPTTDRQVYYMQSQSQLAEDAINEELMKEEMMNDQIGYTQQNREQRKDKDLVKDITTPKAFTTTDDILSVKPIGVDKQKNSSLYTVSPNYKPMKKIEVQAPKSFVRDPDDNSWRNESLSSLGIVFKANNSSKPLTQVLKNKTETELNSLLEKYGKSGEPELRTRLEKIAEQRKSKKRVGEKSGEISYGDSEEVLNLFSESSIVNTPEVTTVEVVPSVSPIPKSTAAVSFSTTEEPDNFVKSTISVREREDPSQTVFLTASPPKKYNYESFDRSDEEPDYSSLSNIDIKKTPVKKIEVDRNKMGPIQTPIPPERKATVQYFPPRGTKPPKVNLNDYDYDFKRKIQDFEQDKRVSPLVYSSAPTPAPIKQEFPSTQRQQNVKDFRLTVTDIPEQKFTNVFTSETPQIEGQDGFDGASYVIKHLRDFIHLAAKESDEDRAAYLTEPSRPPVHSATTHGYLKDNNVKSSDYEDYDRQFRKEVLERFVENFNHNSDRFKVDFPVLYNTSIIHNNFADESRQASSSAFMKRLHGAARARSGPVGAESGCDRAVELAPEYELHYYVPEQEEREVAHADQLLSPVRYQLRL